MSLIPFNQLPDDARLWVFNAERTLDSSELARLDQALAGFVTSWAAHRKDLTAAYELRYNQFVFIGVDESRLPPSGCSIDSLTNALRSFGAELGAELIDAPDVTYRDGDAVRAVDRKEFTRLAETGAVDAGTIVFDKTAARVGDLRNGRWERPARESWHGRAFDLKEQEQA